MRLADTRLTQQQDWREAHRLIAGHRERHRFLEVVHHLAEVWATLVERIERIASARLDDESRAAERAHALVEGGQRLVAACSAGLQRPVDIIYSVDFSGFGKRNADLGRGHVNLLATCPDPARGTSSPLRELYPNSAKHGMCHNSRFSR